MILGAFTLLYYHHQYPFPELKKKTIEIQLMGFLGGSAGKESACNAGDLGLIPGLGKKPGKRERLPTLVFLPGEFHGLYSPWGHKESDTTERLSLFIVDLQCCVSSRCTQSDLVIHTYIHIFFSRFFFSLGYYKILSMVPRAIHEALASYLFYIYTNVYILLQNS